MSKKIITTVGTSLFENLRINRIPPSLKDVFSNVGNVQDIFEDFKNSVDDKLSSIKDSDFTICAELQSIAKIRKSNGDIDVYLICTDTILSPLCAEFIAKRLVSNGISVKFEYDSLHIIEGLIVDGANASTTFEEKGFPNLIQIIKEIEKHAGADNRPILNISGGYKALIPVMTIMGQLYDMEINYMYEDAEELIKISSLPINFDWNEGEFYLEYLKKSGLNEIKQFSEKFSEVLATLRGLGLIQKDKYELTVIGNLYKEYLIGIDTSQKNNINGYLVELKVYKHFMENHSLDYIEIRQGKSFYWDTNEKSKFYEQAQFDNDDTKEQKIEIDIWLKTNDNLELWCEVKSLSETGLRKAKKQTSAKLDFIRYTQYASIEEFRLIVYKLPKTNIMKYERKLNEIKMLFQDSEIQFKLFVIELPENKRGQIEPKKIFENSLTITPFEL